MTETKSKGPIFDPGLCRCCGSIKKCRLLNIEYEYSGQKEIYSDMFFDCFGLLLSQLDGDPKERLICATCVSRLREAHCFRQQVLQCEEFLLQSKLGPDDVPLIELKPGIKVEVSIKQENTDADDNCHEDDNHIDDVGDCGDNDDMDDIPLSETFHKEISKKTARKRKASKGNDSGTDKLKMLSEIKKTKAKLKKFNSDVSDVPSEPVIIPQIPTRPETLLRIDAMAAKAKALRNTATIVKYSYACPFYTPYSSDYFCVYCRERFADPEKFREHNLSHDPAKYQDFALKKKYPQIDIYRIDCRLCSEKINDLNTFKIHIKRVHGKMFFLNVPDGFLKFKLTAKNLSCTECNASFDFFMSLKKHMAEHFGTCICDVCGAHFFEETMLIVHQKTHQKNLESYTCEQCGKTFKSKYSRHLHIAKIHTKESIYQCTKCDQSFFTKTLRIKHMKDVHGEIRKFTCGQCDRFYDNRRSLTEHYRKCHTKYFKHQCNICDKRFYMPCQLKEHMTIHTGERNFRCDQCGKTYPRLRALKLHMQSHNDKKHSCTVCNASFTQKGSLKNHMQKQHQSINLNEQFHLYE